MRKITQNFLMVLIMISLLISTDNTAYARKVTVNESGLGCQSGKYVYYAFEMSGVRMGIMRYDTTTKKKKEIFSYRYKGKDTNGFYDISKKGKYIFATWDLALGTDISQNYIYRIAIDGSSCKRLAHGQKPVVIGNRIYYEKCVFVDPGYGVKASEGTGKWYSMKFDGSDKKRVKKPDIRKMSGYTFYNEIEKTDIIRGYRYYIKDDSLYKEHVTTGKVKKLLTCKNGMYDYYVTGGYILVKGASDKKNEYGYADKMVAYIINTSGTDKNKLAEWMAAE